MTDTPTADAGGPTPEPPAADAAASPNPSTELGDSPAVDSGALSDEGSSESAAAKRRRRGSRGGRNRSRARTEGAAGDGPDAEDPDDEAEDTEAQESAPDDRNPDLPDRHREGKPASVEAGAAALVPKAPRKPQIGDSMPAPPAGSADAGEPDSGDGGGKRKRRRGGRGRGNGGDQAGEAGGGSKGDGGRGQQGKGQSGQGQPGKGAGRGRRASQPVEAVLPTGGVDLDDDILEARRGRERKGRPVGRYLMAVHKTDKATQISVLEGRNLIEHYVSRPSDDVSQIHGNIYLGRVQNVLPGMEAAFVDISTPKNAVLYRGDVHYDAEDVEGGGKGGKSSNLRIEQMLKAKQTIICQVTKNPIGAKGARLTQEVSLPGRFVVLIPNSSTYGISKRLSDDERKRLRNILDKVKPKQHGVIVRTAAEGVTDQEIELDVRRLLDQWNQIDALAQKTQAPALLYREPDMAVRVIREEFNNDYRGVIIDDRELFESVRDYVASISPELADRVELYDRDEEPLPLYERLHIHEQLHKALDRKVWLPSGGSLIIEHTEALTVIDVNTGKNVGTSNLEETVFRNNLEAATEIARQLRLRDVGGIIVVDFIDMEIRPNRDEVIRVFRDALARDKTRTQVFEISELGLCEMTRKRIGEGLLESFAGRCPTCEGRGVVIDEDLLPSR
jgi:ribonuclease E